MSDALEGADEPPDGKGELPPPTYDTSKEDYTGISAGVIHNFKDLHAARDFAEMIVDTVREGLLVLDFDLQVKAANESFYHTFKVRPENTVGQRIYDLGNGEWEIAKLRELLESILPQEKVFNDYEVEHDFKDLGPRVMLLNARRLNHHQLILLAIEDVTERRKSEDEIRELNTTLERRVDERTTQVRELSQALAMAEHKERQRIAHVLHDDLQQVLAGAKMVAEMGTERVLPILDMAISITRSLAQDLSPPLVNDPDVTGLLRWIAERKREQHGLEVKVEVGEGALVPERYLRVLLHQIVSELLFNISKHASARHASIVANIEDGHLRVTVQDDGTGFDPDKLQTGAALGLGLPSIRERLEMVEGTLEVTSAPQTGTRITFVMPVEIEGHGSSER